MVMGVSPVLVVFAAIYHWYPKITGKMYNETMGKWHFWTTFIGAYSIYLPMHYLGILGVPRRYYSYGPTEFIPDSAQLMNIGITYSALFVAVAQILFFINMFMSLRGEKSDPNPWGATSLEWRTPDHPPKHGNWGPALPVCYRWAYDYSVPGASKDFIPQDEAEGPHARDLEADDSEEHS